MSSQNQEGTDLPLVREVQEAWIERLIATKISEAAPPSTVMTTSDTTVSSGASVGSTSSGIGEYPVKMEGGVKVEKLWHKLKTWGQKEKDTSYIVSSIKGDGRRMLN